MHGCQANKRATCGLPIVLGLCPKRKYHYTLRQTIKYEKLVRASYTEVSKIFFDKNILLEISIIALFSIPRGNVPKPSRALKFVKIKNLIAHALF